MSSKQMSKMQALTDVTAAAVDGRLHNVFHRRTQLERLHTRLVQEAEAVQNAIVSDHGASRQEAAIEYRMVMQSVKRAHERLDPNEALVAEYAVANGRDAPRHREPIGIVCVEPIPHTLFYSTISPVSDAIAAGNCVVLVLEQDLRASVSLLRQILSGALETEILAFADHSILSQLPSARTLFINQTGNDQSPRSLQLVSPPSSNLAFVDRTANLGLAAKELVATRFAFDGKSPYAPGVVLVNEFVADEFLQTVVQECINFSAAIGRPIDPLKRSRKDTRVSTAIQALRENDSDLRVVVQEAKHAVVVSQSRKSLFARDMQAPVLLVHAVRSLDDAIDLVGSQMSDACTATYYFASPETAKYLCQFIDSAASFVNHVPRELLLGPISPSNTAFTLRGRYPADVFTRSQPRFVQSTEESKLLAATLSSRDQRSFDQLVEQATLPLPELKRPGGKAIGFFEQGFLVHAGLILAVAVTVSVSAGYLGFSAWRARGR